MSKNQTKLSRELRAVLRIFQYDEELRAKALPFLDVGRHSIDWEGIGENDFGGGHSAAVLWAKAIWCSRIETKSDPFDRGFAMNSGLQLAVIEALAIRWGFDVPESKEDAT